ncbi:unnamed protein product [Durusdinium trenchii]|uniref:Cupin-like domain-containing protein n=1 Tax=Durusdinium trenchii TaxID=1381693 RepID=A0ABP0KFM8_9DINO
MFLCAFAKVFLLWVSTLGEAKAPVPPTVEPGAKDFGGGTSDTPGHGAWMQEVGHSKPVEVLTGLPDWQTFYQDYVRANRPVVLKNAAQTQKAFSKWTDEYLLDLWRKRRVDVEIKKVEERGGPTVQWPFEKFLREMYKVERKDELYAVIGFEDDAQALADVALPQPARCQEVWPQSATLWMSNGGTMSVLHNDDGENFLMLLDGTKSAHHYLLTRHWQKASLWMKAELLHLLAELFTTANLSSRVELHLSDTRLLRLLLEAAHQRALREAHSGGAVKPGPKALQADTDRNAVSGAGERLRGRMLEALRRQAATASGERLANSQSGSSGNSSLPVQDPVRNYIPPAALERAAAELAGLLAGASSPEAPKSVHAFLSEVEELYASSNIPAPASPASPRGSSQVSLGGRSLSESVAEDLKEVLRSLRALDSLLASQTSWRGVMIDPQMPINSMYGPGLIFSVLMHLPGVASPTMVCVGGRVDTLVGQPDSRMFFSFAP